MMAAYERLREQQCTDLDVDMTVPLVDALLEQGNTFAAENLLGACVRQ